MKRILQSIKTKTPALHLTLQVLQDDVEIVPECEAESIVGNFAKFLWTRSGDRTIPINAIYYTSSYYVDIDYVERDEDGDVRLQMPANDQLFNGSTGNHSSFSITNGQRVLVHGVLGATGLNGEWVVKDHTSSTSDGYRGYITLTGSAGVDISGYVDNTGGVRRVNKDNSNHRDNSQAFAMFSDAQIRLGFGSRPVSIEDWCLENEVPTGTETGHLIYGSYATSLPAITSGQSEITFTRQFTNNSGGNLEINELGLMCLGSENDSSNYYFITRDLRSFSIANGATITVNYRIRTQCTPDEGTMIQFNELLTRAFKSTSREAKDTLNQNRFMPRNSGDFFFTSPAGDQSGLVDGAYTNGVLAQEVGPVVGTSTDPVDQTNYQLIGRIQHGDITNPTPGTLVHFGSFADGFYEDLVNDKCGYYVHRMFYNATASPITIREVGLQCGGGDDANHSYDQISYSYLLHRAILDSPVIVAPGESVILSYNIEVAL